MKGTDPVFFATAAGEEVETGGLELQHLYALVALHALVASGFRSDRPMGRGEHDELVAERAWGLAGAMLKKQPK